MLFNSPNDGIRKFCELYVNEQTIHAEIYGHDAVGNMRGENASKEDEKRYVIAQHETQKFAHTLYSDPMMFDLMWCWMVDIEGEDLSENFAEDVIKSGEFENIPSSLSNASNLCESIITGLSIWGFNITDSGGGCGGWHLGYPCTEMESRRLCTLIHTKYSYYIQEGMLRVARKYWSMPKPIGINNWACAERWLKENI
jgi:hypothetical protein